MNEASIDVLWNYNFTDSYRSSMFVNSTLRYKLGLDFTDCIIYILPIIIIFELL